MAQCAFQKLTWEGQNPFGFLPGRRLARGLQLSTNSVIQTCHAMFLALFQKESFAVGPSVWLC